MLESTLRFAPPPRPMPFSLSITNVLNLIVQIGFGVFGFASIFLWTFVANADFSFITFKGDLGRATGTVTRVVDTNASESRSRIRENHFQYSVAGERMEGVSYSTGRQVEPGDRVLVEFLERTPQRARISGQRTGMFSPAVMFVLLFPLVGLALIIFGLRWGSKRSRLLREGVFTTGVLKSKTATNTRVNNRRVYELIFEFTARDGRRCEAKARTSMTDRLQDEREEPLLYNPEKPEDAVMLDDGPGRPRFDETGMLVGRPVAALFSMILPALVIVANVLALMVKLR
jgi:hypothetical protein